MSGLVLEQKCAIWFNDLEFKVLISVDWARNVRVISISAPYAKVLATKVHFVYNEQQLNPLIFKSIKLASEYVSCKLRWPY